MSFRRKRKKNNCHEHARASVFRSPSSSSSMSSLLTSLSPSHQITFNVKKWSHLEGQKTSEIFLMVVVVFSVGDVVFFALHCPPRTSVLPFEDGLVGVGVVVVVAVARLAQPRYEKNEKVSSQKNDRFFISAKSVQCH